MPQAQSWPVLRVSVPAASMWGVLFGMGMVGPFSAPLPILGVGIVVLLGCLWLIWTTRGWALLGALLGAGAALGAVVCAGHTLRNVPEGLTGPIDAGATVIADVRVCSDPMPTSGGLGESSWRASAKALTIATRGRVYTGRIPVLLIGGHLGDTRYGEVVRVSGRMARPLRAGEVTAVIRVSGAPVTVRSPGRMAQASNAVRAALAGAVTGLSADSAALLLGLAIGDESRVSADLREAMLRAGLAHLTAVSGANTTLVMGLAIAVLARLGFGWRTRVWGAGLVLTAFVAVVRPQPSVLRAAAMGVVALLVLARGGFRDGRRALGGAVLVLLVAMPGLASSVGFALSVAATAGLLIAAEHLGGSAAATAWGRWLPPPILAALTVTAAATLATLPLTVGLGNGLSLISLPANLVVAPLVPMVTLAGLAAALMGLVHPGAAHAIASCIGPLAGAIGWVARRAADVPGGVVPLAGGWRAGLATLALLGLGIVIVSRPEWQLSRRILQFGLSTLLLSWLLTSCMLGVRPAWPPSDWIIASCDVGQGDATVIRMPGPGPPTAVLVDAGPDPGALRRCLVRLKVAGVGAVFLTHAHADHIQGLSAIREMWPDRWSSTPMFTSEMGHRFSEALMAGRPPAEVTRAGHRFGIGGLRVEVLWPAREVVDSPENNSSLVLLISVTPPGQSSGELRVLITGDIETEAQLAVMARSETPAADVVKVAHHGSPRQAPGFAAWSGAHIALISVGADNDYGHPAAWSIRQLTDVGMIVGRTDMQGGLAVVRRGRLLGLVTER